MAHSLSGTTQVSRYQKGKTSLDFTEAKTLDGSGICWAVCKSVPRCSQITTPTPHYLLSFFTGQMPFLSPNTQRQKALKACEYQRYQNITYLCMCVLHLSRKVSSQELIVICICINSHRQSESVQCCVKGCCTVATLHSARQGEVGCVS